MTDRGDLPPSPAVGRRTALAVLSALCVPTPGHGRDAASTLVQSAYERPVGRDTTALTRMELSERGRAPRVREMVTYRLERNRGEVQYLARFLAPKDIAGTGLLSLERADGSTEQLLYLPALDRVRRIASDRRSGRFVGSDYTYEDLRERRPSADQHRSLGRDAVSGVSCEVIEHLPVDSASAVYRKRISWIDPASLLALRVDFFERDDSTPSKRWVCNARSQIQGFWTVTDSTMADLSSGHETRLVAQRVLYDRRLPQRLFTQAALSDESIESEYRP